MKTKVVLVVSAVIVFLGLYLLFPHTDLAISMYEANRDNAVLYIQALKDNPDTEYQKEIQRLIKKYDIEQWEIDR